MLTDLFPSLLSCIMVWGVKLQELDREETLTEASHIYPKLAFPFQIAISHVNSTLRHVALSTPTLWASIRIVNRPYRNSQPQSLLTGTRVYIERSNNHPLQIRINLFCHEDRPPSERQLWNEILGLVVGQSLRWERFSLRAECGWVEVAFESIARRLFENDPMPMLTHMSLMLDYHEKCNDRFTPSHIIKLHNTHNLAFLRLRGLALLVTDLQFPPSLKVLHLEQTLKIPLRRVMFDAITECCPSLEHLSIHADIDPNEMPPLADNSLIFSFPQLRSLRICGIDGHVYRIFMSAIDTPKLTSLVLKNIMHPDLDAFGQNMHHRKWQQLSQLKSLSLYNSDLSRLKYGQLFKTLPAVTNFTSFLSLRTGMAWILSFNGSEDIPVPVPWPRLQSLTLSFDANMVESKVVTENILRCRREVGHPLSRASIIVTNGAVPGGEEGTEVNQLPGVHNNVMEVNWIDKKESWPVNQLFVDEYDVLF